MKKDIDDIFKDAFKANSESPKVDASSLWANIEADLDKKEKKKAIPFYIFSIAASLIFVIGLVYFLAAPESANNLEIKKVTASNLKSDSRPSSISNSENTEMIVENNNQKSQGPENAESNREKDKNQKNEESQNLNPLKSNHDKESKNQVLNPSKANTTLGNHFASSANNGLIQKLVKSKTQNKPSTEKAKGLVLDKNNSQNSINQKTDDNVLKNVSNSKNDLLELVKVDKMSATFQTASLNKIDLLNRKNSQFVDNFKIPSIESDHKTVPNYTALTGFWEQPAFVGIEKKNLLNGRSSMQSGLKFNYKPTTCYVGAAETYFHKTGTAMGVYYSSQLDPFQALNSYSFTLGQHFKLDRNSNFSLAMTGNYFKRNTYSTNDFITFNSRLTQNMIFYPDVQSMRSTSHAYGLDIGGIYQIKGFQLGFTALNLINPTFASEDKLMAKYRTTAMYHGNLSKKSGITIYGEYNYSEISKTINGTILFNYGKFGVGTGIKQLSIKENSCIGEVLAKYDFNASSMLFLGAGRTIYANNEFFGRKTIQLGGRISF